MVEPRPNPAPSTRARRADRVVASAAWFAGGIVLAAFAWILGDLVRHGAQRLDWSFLTQAPRRFGREGGIAPILVSSFWILGVCLASSVPLGLSTAVFLAEYSRGRTGLGRWIRASLDVLAGVPSIVFGLFGNAFFCIYLGLGFSILSGGLTLACMVLPIFIRSVEVGLRAVPDDYRLAGTALGLRRSTLLWTVLLPAAAPAIGAGLLLGIGRAMAETAALIFTSGYVDRAPSSWLDSGRALSVHIYDLATNVQGGEASAYGTALVLVLLLLLINLAASWTVDRYLGRRVDFAQR